MFTINISLAVGSGNKLIDCSRSFGLLSQVPFEIRAEWLPAPGDGHVALLWLVIDAHWY